MGYRFPKVRGLDFVGVKSRSKDSASQDVLIYLDTDQTIRDHVALHNGLQYQYSVRWTRQRGGVGDCVSWENIWSEYVS